MDTGSDTLTPKQLRDFGITTGVIVAILFGLGFPWLLDRSIPWWPWILCGILVAWGLLHPVSLRPVHRGWMRFGHLMSRITTPIILGILFFLAVLPTGLIRRMFGYDSMMRKLDPSASTYRVPSKVRAAEDLEKPY